MIEWEKANLDEYELAVAIAIRAKEALPPVDVHSLQMDIIATHVSGCRLKLKKLLGAESSDFLHDVVGIINHLDRESGKLTNCFLPRYAS